MSYSLTFQIFGPQAVLISWPNIINQAIGVDVYHFNTKIQQSIPNGVLESVAAYNSLTLFVNQGINQNKLIRELKSLYANMTDTQLPKVRKFSVPVCYDADFGIDLDNLAQLKNCPVETIISLHTAAVYQVDFIGFLPGFPYLSGLNPLLHTPRLKQPRLQVSKGSVAIGGKQTGIYPNVSAGGWHIIGRTPLSLFDPTKKNPCLFRAFDQIEFKAISKQEFDLIESQGGKYA